MALSKKIPAPVTSKKTSTQSSKKDEVNKKVCILSIDGGGIRGIIPGIILMAIEEELKSITKNPQAALSDYFDLMAGTSTGGILTCCYLIRGGKGRPKFSAKKAVDLYLEKGDEIFSRTWRQKIRSGNGLLDEKYTADELEDVLYEYFGDVRLSQLIRPCVITSYNITGRNAHFFRQHRAKGKGNEKNDFYIRDVARATSAAPTYFETAKVWSLEKKPYPLIDGGVFANNPTLCAYAEARGIDFSILRKGKPSKPGAAKMFILSLDTASVEEKYTYSEAKNWGAASWIKPALDIMMSGNSETVSYQLEQIYDTLSEPDNKDYMRIKTELHGASSDMDDASIDNMNKLANAGQLYVKNNRDKINDIAQKLIKFN